MKEMNIIRKKNINMINIAKEFVSLHKENNLKDWQPFGCYDDNVKLLSIYQNMVNGVYGECAEVARGYYELEISRVDSRVGRSRIFSWHVS